MKKEDNAVHYQEDRDVNGKTIFHNPLLCSQFLRDYVDIPMLKNVRPEDIEDVSERYRTFMGVEFEADTVKKIKCPGAAVTGGNKAAEDLTGLSKMLKEQLEKVESIIAKTPESIVKIISGITYNLCRRLNLPEDETRQYIRNVEGRDMGYLFENMEKMDIQAERRNTAEAREEARQAKEELRQAKEEARRRKEEVQKDIEKEKEEGVRLFIEGYQEVGITREMTSQKLQEKFRLSEEAALEKIALYWKTE